MQLNRRKSPRQPVDYPALIDAGDGSELGNGIVWDISADGARLVVSSLTSVPNKFVLLLVDYPDGKYACEVRWRTEGQIGIVFAPS